MPDDAPKDTAPPALLRRLRDHFDVEPATLPVLEQGFDGHQRPNLHLALEELLHQPHTRAETVGVVVMEEYSRPKLAQLSRAGSAQHFDEGPVEYVDVELPGGRRLACLKQALCLIR